jgi:hypothetical protein
MTPPTAGSRNKLRQKSARRDCYLRHSGFIVQALSLRLPTAEARVQFQVRSYKICSGPNDIGADFLRVLVSPVNSHFLNYSIFMNHSITDFTSTHKQTSYAGEVNNIQIEKTITNNRHMSKSNIQVATIENTVRGIRSRLFWTSARRP